MSSHRRRNDPEFSTHIYPLSLDRLESALPDIMQVIIDNALEGKF